MHGFTSVEFDQTRFCEQILGFQILQEVLVLNLCGMTSFNFMHHLADKSDFFSVLFYKFGVIAGRLRAKFWPDCAIPDTRMKFGTFVDHDQLSWIGYRTTLGDAYCACAEQFSD